MFIVSCVVCVLWVGEGDFSNGWKTEVLPSRNSMNEKKKRKSCDHLMMNLMSWVNLMMNLMSWVIGNRKRKRASELSASLGRRRVKREKKRRELGP